MWGERDEMRPVLVIIAFIFGCTRVAAQELYLLGGVMQHLDHNDRSFSWQLDYRERLGEHIAASISYLNEGHVPEHHRDGHTVQLWTRTGLFDRRFSLAAGVGPFFFFDTRKAKAGASYANDHGWGGVLSLAATWQLDERWLFQLRSNWVETGRDIDSFATYFGIGYQLAPPPAPAALPGAPSRKKPTENEVTLFLGRTIVNSFASEEAAATGVEYRRSLGRYLEWSAAWLYEGDSRLLRRNGLISQFWGVREFLDDRFALGVGGGAYLSIDHYRDQEQARDHIGALSGIITLTASYRLHPHWALRTSWNRIVTSYSRDTDVILGGVGYRF
jgi:hypothetical protein